LRHPHKPGKQNKGQDESHKRHKLEAEKRAERGGVPRVAIQSTKLKKTQERRARRKRTEDTQEHAL
jgi:hypothetical protein